MIPGTLNREWSLARLRQQAFLDEAEHLRRIAAARGEDRAPIAVDRLWARIRSLGPALLHGIANAGFDRPSSGPRGYRDGLL
jgi:hypothetical protein